MSPLRAHVPLLNWVKMVAHSAPLRASRLATMFLSHSRTLPCGRRYFQSAALLLPMVVSRATCGEGKGKLGGELGWGVPPGGPAGARCHPPAHCSGCRSRLRRRWCRGRRKTLGCSPGSEQSLERGRERGRGSQDLGRKGGKGVPPPRPAHIPPGTTQKGRVYFLTMRSMVW